MAGKKLQKQDHMRLTIQQRLDSLDRDIIVLQDTMKLLHMMLKDQNALINEYLVRKVAASDKVKVEEKGRPVDMIYTFVCKQRFDRLEKDIKKTIELMKNLKYGLKTG